MSFHGLVSFHSPPDSTQATAEPSRDSVARVTAGIERPRRTYESAKMPVALGPLILWRMVEKVFIIVKSQKIVEWGGESLRCPPRSIGD